MNNVEFLIILNRGFANYFFAFIFTLIIMLWVLKYNYKSILDPLFTALIFALFANTIPVYLYVEDLISTENLIYFLISEFLFWGFFSINLNKREKLRYNVKFIYDKKCLHLIYKIFILLILSFFIIQIYTIGFAIFKEDRLSLFADSGGLGIISHLQPVINAYLIFYSYYLIDQSIKSRKKILIPYLVLLFIATNQILSGARSSVLIFLYLYFFYIWFYKKNKPSKKITKWICIFAVAGGLYIFSFNPMGNGFQGSLLSLLFRVIASGDIYWNVYPNETYTQIHPAPWLIDLLSNVLYPLRILDYGDSIPPIGTQAVYINNPEKYGAVLGANSRPTIWGYIMFGWPGILFSVIWGWILSSIMKWSTHHLTSSILGTIFCYRIYYMCIAGISDPVLFGLGLFDNLIGFFIVLVIIFGYSWIKKLYNLQYEARTRFN